MRNIYLVLLLCSCGKSPVNTVSYYDVAGPSVTTEVPRELTEQELIEDLVATKNDYRDSIGQSLLTEGLNCSVYNFANSDLDVSFGSAAYNYSMHTEFNQGNQAGNLPTSILPEELQSLYLSVNYSIRCQGYIVITEGGLHQYTLNSDDGSRLWINGTMVVDNEGSHAMLAKSGTLGLERGVYSFRLDYSQSGGGNQGLELKSGSNFVSSGLFYR